MNEAIELCGLASLAAAGFIVALSLGFAVVGVGCLWVAWRRAR